jgi:vacuolar protein sorting-associated protein 13A/C
MQLNFAIWGGKVELKSLELNVNAVNAELDRQASQAPNLALPFRVVEGRFEIFEIDVPWSRLWSRPIVMRAKGLMVTVAPVDPHTAAQYAQASTESEMDRVRNGRVESIKIADHYRLQANEIAKLAEADIQGGENSTDKTMMARLVRRAIENIQIEISNVEVVLQASEASAGVVLKSLRIVTTNKDGEEEFVDRMTSEDKSLHKTLSLQGLGIYLDEKAKTVSLTTINEGDSSEEEDSYHDYILVPLSFEAKLAQADGNVCVDDAKYRVESVLPALDVSLSKSQLESIRKIRRQLEPSFDAPRPLFPEYRPTTKLSRKNVKEWWRYAYRCVGRLNGRRSWVEFFRAFQIRNKYIDLYKRHAFETECSWIQPLSMDEREQMQQIEEDRSISVEGLMTWRNIADARVKKEMEKKESQKTKSSLFNSLFTRSTTVKSLDDDPPITLDSEELKELEKLTLSDLRRNDSELSSDSKVCNLSFKLGSFVVNLTNRDRFPLSMLSMGEVTATFKANADGSFSFSSALESLTIEDRFTPRTLFPEVLSSRTGHKQSDKDRCFLLEFSKTKTGDQKLLVKLEPFEIVVAPVLVLELVSFASFKDFMGPPMTLKEANPMLRESLSGSVDLFYDASQGVDLSKLQSQPALLQEKRNSETDYTSALFDAWKAKIESETLWILDLDLAAPAIIVPESASNPAASVLVVNLGRFTFRYGDIQASPKVKTWFTENPFPQLTVDAQYDYGSIQMTSLRFAVGAVDSWRHLVEFERDDDDDSDGARSILSPIHAAMDFGIEIHPSRPRLAIFVVLPLISGNLAPKDIGRITAVTKTWQRFAGDLVESTQPKSVAIKESDGLSQASNESSSSQRLISATKRANELLLSIGNDEAEVFPLIYFGVELKRLSAMLSNDGGSGVEAHLGSVSASTITLSNGNAQLQLTMGWFCIFDRLKNNFTRRQRVLAHSKLVLNEEDIADPDYDIVAALENVDTIGDESEMADIVILHSPRGLFGHRDPFASNDIFGGNDLAVNTIVDGSFSSLYINWNPYAVRDIVSNLEDLSRLLLSESHCQSGTAIFPSVDDVNDQEAVAPDATLRGCIIVRARLGCVQMALHSALDDLGLFTLSMTDTKFAMAVGTHVTAIRADFSVGNLQASGSELGQTLSSYRTILGVNPEKSKSLLTVEYKEGYQALRHIEGLDESIESSGFIQLSPMCLVYIQSQILALVNYTTEGILGAITTAAASSAAAAAADIAKTGSGRKRFVIDASDFEVVVPQAAYSPNRMSISVAEIAATYDILSPTLGSEAEVALRGVMVLDELSQRILKTPSALQLKVVLPEEGIGSTEDQAIRSSISMGNADFCMSSSQYRQILTMLKTNMGNEELFLRETGVTVTSEVDSIVGAPTVPSTTHAGNLIIENARIIYTAISLAGLSLSLFGVDYDNPIATLTTDETQVRASLFPNGEGLSVKVSLKNLECTDDRKKSAGRDFQALVYQKCQSGAETVGDLMLLEYETGVGQETRLIATIGSPHIVFVPDAIADLLAFFSDFSLESTEDASSTSASKDPVLDALSETKMNQPPAEYSISVVTSECSIVFVDLGSSSLIQSSASSVGLVESATEALVMKGIFDCTLNCSINETGQEDSKFSESWELHGDNLQAYTAYMGSDNDAVQILEPVRVSLYIKKQSNDDDVLELDARFAAVTPVDVCLSMKNVALLSAISSGIFDCLGLSVNENINTENEPVKSLSKDAVERYHRANLLLEGDQEGTETIMDTSVSESIEVFVAKPSSHAGSSKTPAVAKSSLVPKLTIPEMRICFVNDLQGLDDALFRVKIHNVVASGKIETGVCDIIDKAPYTAFQATSNCSITSDYFDQSRQQWKQLLLKPWEVTTRAQRRFDPKTSWKAPQTICDVESFSCQLAITEQFLMSLASAKHMWDLYSTAMTNNDFQSDHLRRAVAATAARTFVTVLPYAIENHCGEDIFFVVQHGQNIKYRCANKTIEYFRFPQPPGKGSGGQRLYGEDQRSKNSLSIVVEAFSVHLPDVDAMILEKCHSYQLSSGAVLIVHVQREGKTVVGIFVDQSMHAGSLLQYTSHQIYFSGNTCIQLS